MFERQISNTSLHSMPLGILVTLQGDFIQAASCYRTTIRGHRATGRDTREDSLTPPKAGGGRLCGTSWGKLQFREVNWRSRVGGESCDRGEVDPGGFS